MNIIRFWNSYRVMAMAEAGVRFSNRIDFLLMILGVTVTSLSTVAALYFMLGDGGRIASWSRGELIFMQGFMLCIFSPQSIFFNGMYSLDSWLKNGSFLRFYLRPAHPLLLLTLERFHPQGFIVFVIGMIYCIFGIWSSPLLYQLSFYAGFIFLMPLAALILWVVNLASISTCFWIGESHPMLMVAGKLNDMSRYPLDIFPKFTSAFLMTLPLAATIWWPCQALLRGGDLPLTILYMSFMASVCVYALHLIWKKGMLRYAGSGG